MAVAPRLTNLQNSPTFVGSDHCREMFAIRAAMPRRLALAAMVTGMKPPPAIALRV